MIATLLQRFSIGLLATLALNAAAAELKPGGVARLVFHDVDTNTHSTADGHVTIITVVTRQDEAKAQAVADHVPDRYVGDSKFRYLTVVNFQRKLAYPFRGLTRAIIRNRLDAEATRLRPEYAAKKIPRDPRRDTLVVADFDGTNVTQLGLAPESDGIAVFVFNGQGKLIARWTDVPSSEALAKAISAAGP